MLALVISYDDCEPPSVKSMSRASLSVIQPLFAPRSLASELVARLTDDITSGKIPPGSRLPTEQELIAATGVSRTVVREAVAALRADGLVITRQGVGAFVPQNARPPLRIEFDQLSLRAVLDVMELRTGIEIEAAGLAGAAAQDRRMLRRHRRRAQARGGRDQREFRAPLQHRRRRRQPAVPPLSRAPRTLHHPAPDDPGRPRHSQAYLQ